MTITDLVSRGLIETPQQGIQILEDAHQETEETPLLARIALVTGAWLSGIFLAFFFGLLLEDTFDTPPVATLIGAIVIAGSLLLFRKTKQLFLEQLALAINFSGTLLFVYGAAEWYDDVFKGSEELLVALVVVTILCPIVFIFSRNAVQQFISIALVFTFGWMAAFEERSALLLIGGLTLSLTLFLFSWLGKPNSFLNRSTTYAGLIATVVTLVMLNLDSSPNPQYFLAVSSLWIPRLVVLGLAIGMLFVFQAKSKKRITLIGFLVLTLGAISWAGAPGVAFAIGVMALAHAVGDRILARFAPLLLTGFLILFYYYLGVPLLTKSIWLMGSWYTVLLLACGLSLRILTPRLSR